MENKKSLEDEREKVKKHMWWKGVKDQQLKFM